MHPLPFRKPFFGTLLGILCVAAVASRGSDMRRVLPHAFKITSIPRESGQIRKLYHGENGMVVTGSFGIYEQQGNLWAERLPPHMRYIQWGVPFAGSLIAIGDGPASLYRNGRWKELEIDDTLSTPLAIDNLIYVGGHRGVYRIDPYGSVRRVLRFEHPANDSSVEITHGVVACYTVNPDAVYVLRGDAFQVTHDLDWHPDRTQSLFRIRDRSDFEGYFCNNAQFTSEPWAGADARAAFSHFDRLWSQIRRWDRQFACVWDGATLYVPTAQGLFAYSTTTQEEAWRLGPEAFGGGLTQIFYHDRGVFAGTPNGAYYVPDPSYVRYADIGGNFHSIGTTSRGAVISSNLGAFYLDGSALDLGGGIPFFVAEPAPGTLVSVERGVLRWGRRLIPLDRNTAHRAVGLVAAGSGMVAFADETTVAVVSEDGTVKMTDVPTQVTSITPEPKHGGFAVGTSQGALFFDAHGALKGHAGTIGTRVYTWRGEAVLVNADATVSARAGRTIGRTPFDSILDGVDWNGALCVMGKLADGSIRVGIVDPASGKWRALDVPMPDPAEALSVDSGRLVVCSKDVATVVSEVRFLEPPAASATIMTPLGPWRPGQVLAPDADEIEVRLPNPRLQPWSNPVYRIQVGTDLASNVAAGTWFKVPRLAWGTTRLTVVASEAGIDVTSRYIVTREWPWWGRWPGFVLYAAFAGLLVQGLVSLRTRALHRRNTALAELVEKRTDELRKANAVKTEFIASMNHEIRNPMNGIIGIGKMLREADVDARVKMLVRALDNCAEELRATMDDVLDFSSIEAGNLQRFEETFDLVDLVEASCGAARSLPGTLALGTIPPGPCWCRGDAGRLRLILLNFLTNALKYGTPERADIDLELREQAESILEATITVTSPGPCLADEEIETLFQSFVRGSRAKATGVRGTGLGLAMCRRYAQAMGGSVGARAVAGGNAFWVRAPFARAPGPACAPPSSLARLRVLAVEDESYNRLILGHYLSSLGVDVDWAQSGAEALAMARDGRYPVLLTDWSLPDANGGQIMARLREMLGEAMPKVVVITAYATREMHDTAVAAGASAFISKPVSASRLRETLGRLALPAGLREEEFSPQEPEKPHADFARLLQLGSPDEILPPYLDQLDQGLGDVRTLASSDPGAAAARVHQLRSAVILSGAAEAGAQIAALEEILASEPGSPQVGALLESVSAAFVLLRADAARLIETQAPRAGTSSSKPQAATTGADA